MSASRPYLVAFVGMLVGAASAAGELRFGRAAVEITPPPEMPFHVPQRPPFPVVAAEGVHDPLQVKATVFDDGVTKAAVVACDLTSIPGHYVESARRIVGEITSVPPANVMITATHTHTGPNIRPQNFQRATPEQKRVALAYLERLPEFMARSVKAAEEDLREARIHGTMGRVEGIAFNRRFLMRDGTVQANPGKADPRLLADIVRPAGPTDPALPMLYLDSAAGEPLATLFNFALHLDTTGGFRYSADFPHTVAVILGAVKGPGMMSQFTYGAAGNINHYFLLDPTRHHRVKGYDEAARIGTHIAAELVRGYQRLTQLPAGRVQASREIVSLEVHAEVASALARQYGNAPSFEDRDVRYTRRGGGYTFDAEVMVIAVGDEVAFVGAPGELFVELGFAIKHGSPYQFTFVNSLANGSIGYVPNRKGHSEGAYGASPQSTRCSPGAGEAIVESAVRQLIALRNITPTDF